MRSFRLRRRLNTRELATFTGNLAAVVRYAGSVTQALEAFAADPKNKGFAPIVRDLGGRMADGATLAEALEAHSASFSPMYRTIVRAGETSGKLSGVLEDLAGHCGYLVPERRGRPGTFAYFLILFFLGWAVLGLLLTQVVPVFAEIFQEFGGGMPAPTRLVVGTSNYMSQHGFTAITQLLTVGTALFLLGLWMRRHGFGSHAFDRFLLRVPILGRRHYADVVGRFSRAAGLMLASGVPAPKTLGLAAEEVDNAVLRKAAYDAAHQVEDGETLARALEHTRFFPSSYGWLLRKAEGRGALGDGLLGLAAAYEQRPQHPGERVLTIALPVFVFVLLWTIGFIVVSLYLPIFTLGDAIIG